ncbi:hypothetical protein [Lapidilactobacillus luobeiensis]|uniref:hypothetical protein n=1 Tax=Lapidilactobacillus luobeiensis TaxID=2950371 RepID=UPI0021C3D12A|nr:hypothetical protein [Lapidilactobacillus luobeiensis]
MITSTLDMPNNQRFVANRSNDRAGQIIDELLFYTGGQQNNDSHNNREHGQTGDHQGTDSTVSVPDNQRGVVNHVQFPHFSSQLAEGPQLPQAGEATTISAPLMALIMTALTGLGSTGLAALRPQKSNKKIRIITPRAVFSTE